MPDDGIIMSFIFEGNALILGLELLKDSNVREVWRAISAWSWRHLIAIYRGGKNENKLS